MASQDATAPGIDPGETATRARFRRNRRLANGLLLAAGGVFFATYAVEEPGFWTGLVRSGAEAGLVGGIADWFAVTALFRHPLGLPIPHTAIIPKNQARIGGTLGRFLERHFLTEAVLKPKLRRAHLGRRLVAWLASPEAPKLLVPLLAAGLVRVVRALDNRDLHRLANRSLGRQLRRADAVPALVRVVTALAASGQADVLFERAVKIGERWLKENRDHVERMVSERSRWWIPRALDRRIAATIVDNVIEVLGALGKPGSEARTRFQEALTGLVAELSENPEQRAKVNAFKNKVLDHPELQEWLADVLTRLSQVTTAELKAPGSDAWTALDRAVRLFGQALAADAAMQRHVDFAVERLGLFLTSYRSEIATFVEDVVKSWDTRTLTDRLELAVGSDLQYIRMNGTVVGAAVGCVLYLVTQALFY